MADSTYIDNKPPHTDNKPLKPLIVVQNLSISVQHGDSVTSLTRDVSFQIQRGEVFGLVGESGSGKSITAMSLLQLLPEPGGVIEKGHISFEDKSILELSDEGIRSIRGKEIAMVFQEPTAAMNPLLSIGEQLRECFLYTSSVDKREREQRIADVLKDVGLLETSRILKSYPHELSGGMLQRVIIAMALLFRPKLIIADEPTTALDVTIQAQIMELLVAIQKKYQTSILLITHNMGLISKYAQRVAVMHNGGIVEEQKVPAIFQKPRHTYTQKLLKAALFYGTTQSIKQPPSELQLNAKDVEEPVIEPVILSAQNIYKSFSKRGSREKVQAVQNVHIEVYRNEIVSLVGESGSGKSTLARCLFGLGKTWSPDQGTVTWNGCSFSKLQDFKFLPRDSYQMIFQDPYTSLNPRHTVYEILAEPLKVHKILPKKRNKAHTLENLKIEVANLLDKVGLPRESMDRYPHAFSGGQRQRISIARALATDPKCIVCDEIVSALDVSIQAEIIQLLLALKQEYGLSLLFISHDLTLVRSISNRVYVMHQGKVVEEGKTEVIFQNPREEYTQKLLASSPVIEHSPE
jgi:ABC-type glutathione transport system ATPase component